MKLSWFKISNFHSIVNSGKINIEELMVLVGKNQAGKSSVLHALEYLSFTTATKAPSELTTIDGVDSDFEDGTITSRQVPIVTANFHLEKKELEQISKNLSNTYSSKMENKDPFEKFVTSLMKEAETKVKVKSTTSESVNDVLKSEESTSSETKDTSAKSENILNQQKFSKLIKQNFKNILIQKFVDGEYSININDEKFYFINPTNTVSPFRKLGREIWDELKNDFNRAPNDKFKDKFEETIDKLYFFKFKDLFSINIIEPYNNFISEGLDDILKQKLTSYKQPISDLFKNIPIQKQFHALISVIFEKMPKIFYFTNYQRLEDSLTLTEIIDNPTKHVTFVNFLKLAGISIDHLKKQKDKVARLRQYLTKHSGDVSEKIKKVYKQEKVDFVIDFHNDVVMIFTCYPPNLTNLLPPSAGSAGFQWYIGFYINFAIHTDLKYQNAILLLDDPGVLLHPSGHKDLLEELKGYTDKNITIIYSTHLPSLIPKDNFSAIRVVKKENMKTEIIENFWKLDKHDSWSPVRSVLGVDFADSLIAGSKTLMVEGPADIIYIQGFKEIIEKQTKTKFDLFIIPLEGVTKSNFYITLFTSLKVSFIALVDDDHNYSDLPTDKIIKISTKNKTRVNQKDFEIEDLLEPEIIFKALNTLYNNKFNDDLLTELKRDSTKDTLTIIEDFKLKKKIIIKLDKVMLAKTIIRDMKINISAHTKTLENFENILTKIEKKLK